MENFKIHIHKTTVEETQSFLSLSFSISSLSPLLFPLTHTHIRTLTISSPPSRLSHAIHHYLHASSSCPSGFPFPPLFGIEKTGARPWTSRRTRPSISTTLTTVCKKKVRGDLIYFFTAFDFPLVHPITGPLDSCNTPHASQRPS